MDENSGHVMVILLAVVLTFAITIISAKLRKKKK